MPHAMRLPVVLIALLLVPVVQGVEGGSAHSGPLANIDGDAPSRHVGETDRVAQTGIGSADRTSETDEDAGSGVDLWMHEVHTGSRVLLMATHEPAQAQGTFNSEASGFGSSSGCVEDPSGSSHLMDQQQHSWIGHVTPTLIDYNVSSGPRIFPPQGMGHEISLADAPAQLTWFLETRSMAPAGIHAPLPMVPDVRIEAILREGGDHRMEGASFRDQPVLARGNSDAVTLHPDVDHPQVEHHTVDGVHVYGFTFDVQPVADDLRIDPAQGFHLQVDVTMDEPVCEEGYLMPDLVRLHGSDGLWSRLHLSAHDVMQVPTLHPQRHGDDILIHAEARSAFGAYDTDVASWRMLVEGPATLELLAANVTQRVHEHDHLHDAVSATWRWHNVGRAPDGEYTITFQAHNLQGTAQANRTLVLSIEGDDWTACDAEEPVCMHLKRSDKQTPALTFPLLLASLASLAGARRRI